jgi:hypothetical protein
MAAAWSLAAAPILGFSRELEEGPGRSWEGLTWGRGRQKTKGKRQKTKGGEGTFVFCLLSFVFLGTEPSTKFDSAPTRQYPDATFR